MTGLFTVLHLPLTVEIVLLMETIDVKKGSYTNINADNLLFLLNIYAVGKNNVSLSSSRTARVT